MSGFNSPIVEQARDLDAQERRGPLNRVITATKHREPVEPPVGKEFFCTRCKVIPNSRTLVELVPTGETAPALIHAAIKQDGLECGGRVEARPSMLGVLRALGGQASIQALAEYHYAAEAHVERLYRRGLVFYPSPGIVRLTRGHNIGTKSIEEIRTQREDDQDDGCGPE